MRILQTDTVPNPAGTSLTAYLLGVRITDTGNDDGIIALASANSEADGVIQYTTDGAATLMCGFGSILPVTFGGVVQPGGRVKVGTGSKAVAAADGEKAIGVYLGGAATADGDIANIYWLGRSGIKATTLTDNSGGAAGSTIAAGVGVYNLTFQFDLADIADGDLVSDLLLNHKFKIIENYWATTEPVTTGAKATTITLAIDDVDVTNSSVALTSANCTPAGAKVQNAGALALNTGSATATLTVKAGSTTAFAEGKGVLVIAIQNMDVADAFASLAAR